MNHSPIQYRLFISILQPVFKEKARWGEWREFCISHSRVEAAKKLREHRKYMRSINSKFRIKIIVEAI